MLLLLLLLSLVAVAAALLLLLLLLLLSLGETLPASRVLVVADAWSGRGPSGVTLAALGSAGCTYTAMQRNVTEHIAQQCTSLQ